MKVYYIYIILLIVCIYTHSNNLKEGFSWTKQSVGDFLTFQNTVNPTTQFNMSKIQSQASEEELSYLLHNGYWPWSEKTKSLFMDEVSHNPMIRINPKSSLDYTRTVYNENATKQLLSWNTKEGQFLLSGATLYNNGRKTGNVKCEMDEHGKTFMNKTTNLGDNLWNGYKNTKTTVLKNSELPEIPGFSFIKKSCNPCVALDNDYSCPFKINTKDSRGTSEIWKSLWSV